MCGIFGAVSQFPNFPSEELTKNACAGMIHRGPDAEGFWQKNGVCLGHRRLSIIDLTEGAQPMTSVCGRYTICYNGEVYNHVELRKQLSEAGFAFRTRSDTETLMQAYAAWGKDCLLRLEGMFAFAIVDLEKRELFICRDLFGIKPLFYRIDKGGFLFSSELPPLLSPLLPAPDINPAAPALFFRYQYVPAPHTIYKDIYKLPAAHWMRVDFEGNILDIEAYGDFSFKPESMTRAEAVELADTVIEKSVAISTRSDVPVGIFLSGGIDSTLVAMNVVKTLGTEIPAFTIAFKEDAYSELEYARVAAKVLGLKLHAAYVGEPDLDKLGNILSFYGEPFGDASVLPTWHVSRLAREHCTVAMSGDGGDELFGGYNNYIAWLKAVQGNHLTGMLRSYLTLNFKEGRYHKKQLKRGARKSVEYWHRFFQINSPEQLGLLLRPPFAGFANSIAPAMEPFKGKEKDFADLDLVQTLDCLTTQADAVLQKVDRASMQHSLEVRPPLLTASVLRMALSLPVEHRLSPEERGKAVLKEILLKKGFDRSFIFRRKQGFGIPVRLWFLKGRKARTMLEELLLQSGKELDQFIDVGHVRKMLDKHSEKYNFASELWMVMAFAHWLTGRKN
ncbi:asparagine synthase (glutamine-hydrolyzing) [Desulfovibrio sp. OttesenSCG-928-A18]|nr:asparagine synthase (glutamine-hydrolyzing) [Desulfovibrio sp. OttesenSCG-928-A18]